MTNIILAGLIALLVGGLLGFAIGKATQPKQSSGGILGLVSGLTGLKL